MAILVDDAPWADDFTLRFLVYLAERVDDVPVAVVVAIRSGDPGAESQLIGDLWQAASVPPIRPAELSESAVAELLAAALPDHTIDPELVQTVSRETGGNPLFVVAVADAIRAGEDVAITTPESMRRHVVRRLARLDPAARALSKAAAVLGDDAAIGDVIRLADLGQDVGLVAAAELVQANVLASSRSDHVRARDHSDGDLQRRWRPPSGSPFIRDRRKSWRNVDRRPRRSPSIS